eukprot:784671-Prorocentrum_minimum.AAC.1
MSPPPSWPMSPPPSWPISRPPRGRFPALLDGSGPRRQPRGSTMTARRGRAAAAPRSSTGRAPAARG